MWICLGTWVHPGMGRDVGMSRGKDAFSDMGMSWGVGMSWDTSMPCHCGTPRIVVTSRNVGTPMNVDKRRKVGTPRNVGMPRNMGTSSDVVTLGPWEYLGMLVRPRAWERFGDVAMSEVK